MCCLWKAPPITQTWIHFNQVVLFDLGGQKCKWKVQKTWLKPNENETKNNIVVCQHFHI